MSSLPFSLASPIPTNLTSSSLTTRVLLIRNSHSTQPSSGHSRRHDDSTTPDLRLVIEKENSSNSLLIRRREVGIGLGCLFYSLLDNTLEAAAAEATAPCELTPTPSGLAFCDKVVGTGPEASKGQLIKAHYVGKLENGKVFDSSYNRGKPLTFRIGVGEVIKGWDQGILGGDGVPPMLAGGKRSLKLPPQLGYGMRGAGCKGGSCIIPPDAVLLFDVEFMGKA